MKKCNSFVLMILTTLVATLFLTSCGSKEEKQYVSYIPPKIGQLGEEIKLDPSNTLKITGQRVEKDAKGRKVFVVTYDWTNTSKGQLVGKDAYLLTASQNGGSLKPELSVIKDKKKLVTALKPGETLTGIEQGFVMLTDDPVTLSLSGKQKYIFIDGKPQFNHKIKIELPAVS